MTNGSNHWILRHLTGLVKLKPWLGGHEVLFAATSDHLPSHSIKDGRATDSCFALIAISMAYILIVVAG